MSLCCDTIGQSEDPQWFGVRRLRISASTNVHFIKTREKKTIESLIADFFIQKNLIMVPLNLVKRMKVLLEVYMNNCVIVKFNKLMSLLTIIVLFYVLV